MELHVCGAFDELLEGGGLILQSLVDRVIGALKDEDVLLDLSIIRGLDSHHDEETKILPESVLFARGTERLAAKVPDQGADQTRAH